MDRELKYRRLDQASPEELSSLKEKVKLSEWRQRFHIQPIMGLLNDLTGFLIITGNITYFINGFRWVRITA